MQNTPSGQSVGTIGVFSQAGRRIPKSEGWELKVTNSEVKQNTRTGSIINFSLTSMVVVWAPSGILKRKNGFSPESAQDSPSRNISVESHGFPYVWSQSQTTAVCPGTMICGSNLKKILKILKKTKTSYSFIDLHNNRVGMKHTFVVLPGSRISCNISENIPNALQLKKKASSSWLASEILSIVNYQKVKVQQEDLPNLHSPNGFSLEG